MVEELDLTDTTENVNPGGAYGLRLTGIPQARQMLVDAPAAWSHLHLLVRPTSEAPPRADWLGPAAARVRLQSGGWVELDRHRATATFCLPSRPSDATLVHPHLAAAAIVVARWLGRESFHGGAFFSDGGVWAVLGEKGDGKSTLLASLALSGVPILADDVLVLDRGTALAGPRSVDLRREAAERLHTGAPIGRVGLRDRWRMTVAPIAPELPLRGWVILRWGDRVDVQGVRGARRLELLLPHRGIRVPPNDAAILMALSELPMLVLQRPRRWKDLHRSSERLLSALPR